MVPFWVGSEKAIPRVDGSAENDCASAVENSSWLEIYFFFLQINCVKTASKVAV